MTLREFIKLYNFRQFYKDKENTQIIRIYTELPSDWFEFGVNDWWFEDNRDELVEQFLHKRLLDREVTSINYDYDNDVFCIRVDIKENPKK